MDIWINNQNGQIRVSNDKKSDDISEAENSVEQIKNKIENLEERKAIEVIKRNKKSDDIFLESLYKDLTNSKFKGKSIVKVGFRLSKESHSLIALINDMHHLVLLAYLKKGRVYALSMIPDFANVVHLQISQYHPVFLKPLVH